MQELKNSTKLDKSYATYRKIINYQLPYKFSYLDDWLLKKSNLLLAESKQLYNKINLQNNNISLLSKNYKKYQRGTIVKVDFGIGIGSEMSQVHFAIVLNNYDNYKNNVLTVINSLIHNYIVEIEEKLSLCKDDPIKITKMHKVLNSYQLNDTNTYACCSLITTISKTRIVSPINEYDIVGHKKCPKEILNLIDRAVNDRFTAKY